MADGISWVPLYSALAGGVLTGGIALLVSKLNHRYTLEREEKSATAKREAELYFISTELVFRLERFAQECADVVNDTGEEDEQGCIRTTTTAEPFTSDGIAGNWRVLPARILYRIRELTVLIPQARRTISIINEWDHPPDWQMTFRERRYQYSLLGMRAVLLAKRLRKLNHMPSLRLDSSSWSAQHVLRKQWRKERNFRACLARTNHVAFDDDL